ncbi:MAG: hypothetical protein IT551_04340 [Novosphingobium sp.]|jgi:hypothetical protein|nr:hypothetical protein [Novosphingobium sp.]
MSQFDFIFMLTRNDRTVEDAATHLETALRAGVGHIGFKDIGLPFDDLARLARRIKDAGARAYIEVVSVDRESELRSVRAAVDLGVDFLLGGTHVEDVLPVIAGTGMAYYPFPGRITGHPSILEGDTDSIVASAVALCRHPGVSGLDLLAYRAQGDVPALIRSVCAAARKPVIVAGSIDCADQIAAARAGGAAAFTIGTSALDGRFPAPGTNLEAQLAAIMQASAGPAPHAAAHLFP